MGNYRKIYSRDLTDREIFEKFKKSVYPESVICPHCGSVNIYAPNIEERMFRCRDCLKKFSILKYTYLENTNLKLRDWFEVINYFVREVLSNQVPAKIGVQESWSITRLYKRIRNAITEHSHSDFKKRRLGAYYNNLEKIEKSFDRIGDYLEISYEDYEYFTFIVCLNEENSEQLFVEYAGNTTNIFHSFISGKKRGENKLDWAVNSLLNRIEYNDEEIYPYVSAICYFREEKDKSMILPIIRLLFYNEPRKIKPLKELGDVLLRKYRGIPKKNIEGYIKELEFRFNNRALSVEKKVELIIEALMMKRDS